MVPRLSRKKKAHNAAPIFLRRFRSFSLMFIGAAWMFPFDPLQDKDRADVIVLVSVKNFGWSLF
jgi:hypothetical protein